MNHQQSQHLINDFHQWVGDKFLPEEENVEKDSLEWMMHLNGLASMVADFVCYCPEVGRLEITDTQAVVNAFGEFVKERLNIPPVEPGAKELPTKHSYYMWPFCMYFGCMRSAASLN
jgi:hypothetical protein